MTEHSPSAFNSKLLEGFLPKSWTRHDSPRPRALPVDTTRDVDTLVAELLAPHVGDYNNPGKLSKWDRRYIEMAAHVASWSKDTAQVGCVIVNPTLRRVVAFSFNGFPANIDDNVQLLHNRENKTENKVTKLAQIIHAEQNALLYAGREARGCHAYVVGRPVCNSCAILLIQAGVERVISGQPLPTKPPAQYDEWCERGRLALELFEKAGVGFSPIPHDLLATVKADYGLDNAPTDCTDDGSCCG